MRKIHSTKQYLQIIFSFWIILKISQKSLSVFQVTWTSNKKPCYPTNWIIKEKGLNRSKITIAETGRKCLTFSLLKLFYIFDLLSGKWNFFCFPAWLDNFSFRSLFNGNIHLIFEEDYNNSFLKISFNSIFSEVIFAQIPRRSSTCWHLIWI